MELLPLDILVRQIQGAERSIEVIATLDPDTGPNSSILRAFPALAAVTDNRIARRCLLYSASTERARGGDVNVPHVSELRAARWEVRWMTASPSLDMVCVDRRICHGVWGTPGTREWVSAFPEAYAYENLLNQFEDLWVLSAPIPMERELLYEDLLRTTLPEVENRIVRVSFEEWRPLLRQLAESPTDLYSLPPRKFEEMVRELLEREGYDAQLTQQTRDGGVDILAQKTLHGDSVLYLVECKRYAKRNPVGVGVVRALYGVVEDVRATKGLIVTTSRFTADALKKAEDQRFRMSLRGYDELVAWLRRVTRCDS